MSVLSGSGNVVSENLYQGTNGPASPVPANDINVNSSANNGQLSPTLLSTSLSGGNLVVQFTLAVPGGTPGTTTITLESYQDLPSAPPISSPIPPVRRTSDQYPLFQLQQIRCHCPALGQPEPRSEGPGDGHRVEQRNLRLLGEVTVPASPYVVTANAASGFGSLYQVIQFADSHTNPAPDGTTHITFAITGSTVIGYNPSFPLDITVPMTIDGTSQSGVQLNGGGQASDGLVLASGSDGSTIQGLDIVNFAGAGIRVESKSDTIVDNRIGTNAAGTGAGPGNSVGILIDGANGGQGATIGGTTPTAANIIGFNYSAGVSIGGSVNTGTVVIGNFIGTDSASDPLGNLVGVSINASGNTIGQAGAGNTIGFSNSPMACRSSPAAATPSARIICGDQRPRIPGPGQRHQCQSLRQQRPGQSYLVSALTDGKVTFTENVPINTPLTLEFYKVDPNSIETTGTRAKRAATRPNNSTLVAVCVHQSWFAPVHLFEERGK